MDVRELMLSGILESYALGLGTASERSEMEAFIKRFPEVQNELEIIQSTLDVYATHELMQAPQIKQEILKTLNQRLSPGQDTDEILKP